MDFGCLLQCKDTKFSANHNQRATPDGIKFVVYYSAKILNFLQITTYFFYEKSSNYVVYYSAKILNFLQITTLRAPPASSCRCLLQCKDTKFSANHNRSACSPPPLLVVYYSAKILNFLQITTGSGTTALAAMLFIIVQRY